MIDLTGFIRVIVPANQDMDRMPDIAKGHQAGVKKEKYSAAKQKHQQRGSPHQITEINYVLSGCSHA